jgi:hypothetical protein
MSPEAKSDTAHTLKPNEFFGKTLHPRKKSLSCSSLPLRTPEVKQPVQEEPKRAPRFEKLMNKFRNSMGPGTAIKSLEPTGQESPEQKLQRKKRQSYMHHHSTALVPRTSKFSTWPKINLTNNLETNEERDVPLFARSELTQAERRRTIRGREKISKLHITKVLTRSGLSVFEDGEEISPITTTEKPKTRFRFSLKRKPLILDYHRKEIARQLALIDFEIFSKIESKEFFDQQWVGEQKEICAPNITAFTERFNLVSQWVITEIVTKERLEARVRSICKFIKIAKRSLDINNYNAMVSIMSALASNPVYRLRNTWDSVPSEYMQIYIELCTYTSSKDNYKLLRATMKERAPPGVPHMGLYLKDLMFIEDGVPEVVVRNERELINMAKARQFGIILRDIRVFQKNQLSFEPYEELRNLLLNLTVYDDDELYELSLKREERVSH